MKVVFALAVLAFCSVNQEVMLDFGSEKYGMDWIVINDGVMGGKSEGKLTFTDTTLIFTGEVSLENNGGFTSLKSAYEDFKLDSAQRIEIKYRLEGQSIALYMEGSNGFADPYIKATLDVTEGWKTVELEWNEFRQFDFGRPTGGVISNDFISDVKYLGFITGEKRKGSFRFEVAYINFL